MFPQSMFDFLGAPVTPWVGIYLAAAVPAMTLGLHLARKRGIPLKLGFDCALFVVAAAYVGSRLLFALQWYVSDTLLAGWSFGGLLWEGGQASMGALTVMLTGIFVFFRFHPGVEYPLGGMDVVVTPTALYQGIARLGCFAQGCCYGKPAEGLAWAVTFSDPRGSCPLLGTPLHPAQLYLVAGNLALAGALTVLAWRPAKFRGTLLGIYLIGYGSLRFVVEFFRADLRPFVGWLSLNQWICLLFLAAGVAVLAYRRGHPPESPLA